MFRILLLIGLSSLLYMGTAQAQPSKECRSCMKQCPHQTRDIKACDRGCPKVCSASDALELQGGDVSSCAKCMSACPHPTRDIKECDRGCPKVCDSKKLTKLLIHANTQLKKCGSVGKYSTSEEAEVEQ